MGLQRKTSTEISPQEQQPSRGEPQGFGGVGEDHVALGCSLLPRGLGSRRDFAWKRRGKGLLLVGHEKVPHGSGLTGDHGGDTADSAGSLNHRLLFHS